MRVKKVLVVKREQDKLIPNFYRKVCSQTILTGSYGTLLMEIVETVTCVSKRTDSIPVETSAKQLQVPVSQLQIPSANES